MFLSRVLSVFILFLSLFSQAMADTQVVGTTAGSFSVGTTGSAQFAIPIFAPPGINGMDPDVALVYDSRSGSGWAGLGWNLSGFSAITRCGKTLAKDGEANGVTLTSEDRFCLDGQPLVLQSGTYGAQASFYRTEIESGYRVTAYKEGTLTDGPNRFRVQTPDGRVMHYGLTGTSQIKAQGSDVVRVWAVSDIRDLNDNRIVFTYSDNHTTGEYYPTKIEYTTNPTAGLSTPRFSMDFQWSARPTADQRKFYLAGSLITMSQRLEKILVKYANPISGDPTGGDRIVREYRLNYADEDPGYSPGDGDSDLSYLASVQECAKKPNQTGSYDCFAPTTFDWQAGDEGWIDNPNATTNALNNLLDALSGDYNNDGFQDLFMAQGTWRIYPGSATGFPFSSSGVIDTGIAVHQPENANLFDYDGDGHIDLLTQNSSGEYEIWRNNAGTWATSGVATGAMDGALPFDMDGDGLSDLLFYDYSGDKFYIKMNSGASLGSTADASGALSPIFTNLDLDEQVINVNNDPKHDLLAVTGHTWQVLTSNGTTLEVYQSLGAESVVLHPRMLDLNGDGLSDVVYVGTDDLWKVRINNGNGFDAVINTGINPVNPDTAQAVSFDGDGKQELMDTDEVAVDDWTRWTYQWNGTNLVLENTKTNTKALPVLMDVDGDGYDDGATVNNYVGVGAFLTYFKHANANASAPADTITRFTDGLGNYEDVTYETLAVLNGTDYSQTSTSSGSDDRDYSGGMYVVQQFVQNDGMGGTFSMSYEYKDAKFNTQGRGFLGFGEFMQTDSRVDGTSVVTEYRQDFPYIGRPTIVTTKQPNGAPISITDLTWNNKAFGTGSNTRTVVYVSKNKIREYDLSSTLTVPVHVRTAVIDLTTDVDAPGATDGFGVATNKLTAVSSVENPVSPYSGAFISEEITPRQVPVGSNWCLGLPQTIEYKRSDPNNTTPESRYSDPTFDTKCRLTSNLDGPSSDTKLQLTTTLAYDGKGNITSVTRTNVDEADRRTEVIYDADAHYPEKIRFKLNTTDFLEVERDWDRALGVLVQEKDPNDIASDWTYDKFGRLDKEERVDKTQSTTLTYVDCDPCTWPANASYKRQYVEITGAYTTEFYDSLGRTIGSQSQLVGLTSRQEITYDQFGRVITQTNPYEAIASPDKKTSSYIYDVLGRVTKQTDPKNAETEFIYAGLVIDVEDANNHTTKYESDVIGQIVKVTDANSNFTTYKYTGFGDLKETVDPLSNKIAITYDAIGNRITLDDPDLGQLTYRYNVYGELVCQLDPNTSALPPASVDDCRIDSSLKTGVNITYDAIGRITLREEKEGDSTFVYDTATNGTGFLHTATGPDGHLETYTYNAQGRMSRLQTTMAGQTFTTDATYHNSTGQVKTIKYPTSTSGVRFEVEYDYDTYGFLSKVKDKASPSTVFYELNSMNALGQATNWDLGNGVNTDRFYELETGLLKTISTNKGTTSLQDLEYLWDSVGNLTRREDKRSGAAKIERFVYDALNRLDYSTLDGVQNGNWSYNEIGNITWAAGIGTYNYPSSGGASVRPHAVTSISGPQAASYSYDANGNMTSRAGNSIEWYSYDKPKKFNKGSDYEEFHYAADRSRYKRVSIVSGTPTTTLYVAGFYEKETSGPTAVHRHHVYANGEVVAIHERHSSGTNETKYIHRDHLSSVVLITDETGLEEERLSYDAFGRRRNADWTSATTAIFGSATDRGYTGHEHLDNPELIHMNGRVYDPTIGRMISADPFVPNPMNLQSFNRYSYVRNNPLTFVDPSGFQEIPTDTARLRFRFGNGVGYTLQPFFSGAFQIFAGGNPLRSGGGRASTGAGLPVSASSNENGNSQQATERRLTPRERFLAQMGVRCVQGCDGLEDRPIFQLLQDARFLRTVGEGVSDMGFRIRNLKETARLNSIGSEFSRERANSMLGQVVVRISCSGGLFCQSVGDNFQMRQSPSTDVPFGLEGHDTGLFGLHLPGPIDPEGAEAILIGVNTFTGLDAILGPRFQNRISKALSVGLPVFVFTTDRDRGTIVIFEPGMEPIVFTAN